MAFLDRLTKKGRERISLGNWLDKTKTIFQQEIISLQHLKDVSEQKFEFLHKINELWTGKWEGAEQLYSKIPELITKEINYLKDLQVQLNDEDKLLKLLLKEESHIGFSKDWRKKEQESLKSLKKEIDKDESLQGYGLEKEYKRLNTILSTAKDLQAQDKFLLENLKGQKEIFSKKGDWRFLSDKDTRTSFMNALALEKKYVENIKTILETSSETLKKLLTFEMHSRTSEKILFSEDFTIIAERNQNSHENNDFVLKLCPKSSPNIFTTVNPHTSFFRVNIKTNSDTLEVLSLEREEHDTGGTYPLDTRIISSFENKGEDSAHHIKLKVRDTRKLLHQNQELSVTLTVETDHNKAERTYYLKDIQQIRNSINEQRKPEDLFYDDLILVRAFNEKYLEKERLTKNKVLYASPMRETIHFSLNHFVLSHGQGSWDDTDTVILIPFNKAYELNKNNLYGGVASDVFFVGFIRVPAADSVILTKERLETKEGFMNRVNTEIKKLGYPVTAGGRLTDYNVDKDPLLDPVWYKFCEEHKLSIGNHTFTEFGPPSSGDAQWLIDNSKRDRKLDALLKKKLLELLEKHEIETKNLGEEGIRQLVDKLDSRLFALHIRKLALELLQPETYTKYNKFINAWLSYWNNKAKKTKLETGGMKERYDKEDLTRLLNKLVLEEKRKTQDFRPEERNHI